MGGSYLLRSVSAVLTPDLVVDAMQLAGTAEPAGLLPARQQMALSLGWHIVLACFGVAFPAMIFVMHLRGIRREDPVALGLARRWAKVSAVLFAIGAVSGTVLSFEMGLLWPGLMGTYGDVLGLPFAFEGLAFFLEAIFLGIYLYGWGRMPAKRHVLMVLPMAITGIVGAYCVVAVNAWMNVPTGFRLVGGEVTDVQPWAVLFNQHAFLQFAHMWVGAYMVAGFSVAGVYAAGMLRGRRDAHHRLGFMVPFVFASIAAVTQPFVGHVLGFGLDERQPAKLAAFELAETTESPSPLRLGGVVVDGEVVGAIDIPVLGSLIAMNSLDDPVPGLDTIPEEVSSTGFDGGIEVTERTCRCLHRGSTQRSCVSGRSAWRWTLGRIRPRGLGRCVGSVSSSVSIPRRCGAGSPRQRSMPAAGPVRAAATRSGWPTSSERSASCVGRTTS